MSETTEIQAQIDQQRRKVQSLQTAVYSQTDPAADPDLRRNLADAMGTLRELEQRAAKPADASKESEQKDRPSRGRFLGETTTGLVVEERLLMDPLPTGAYHLMDPESEPLLSVKVSNKSRDERRVCVKAYIEGLSAQAVKTIEIKPREDATFDLQPTLFPERAQLITEVQRATLHVIVEDLDGKLESHNTHVITCLARSASFNSVRRPETDELLDLSHYYGAWVTPYAHEVQAQIRNAVASMADQRMLGYQGDPELVPQQVAALYQALRQAEIVYVNSVIDYGAAAGLSTQRTRLPRESLEVRSANCIDGTVLMASLLEGVSLNPAIVLVPGHAFLGWEKWPGAEEWQFLETTMIGTHDFQAACESGQRQYEQQNEFGADQIKLHSIADLRARKIWPME